MTQYEQLAFHLGFVSTSDEEIDLRHTQTLCGGEPRSTQLTGTRALMLAVLEDAIRCLLDGRKHDAQEAADWIASACRRSPFSFVVICETLGLDPQATRSVLNAMKAAKVESRSQIPRARKNVRVPGRVVPSRSPGNRSRRRHAAPVRAAVPV